MGKPPPQTVLEILREAAHAMEAYCKCQITQDKHTVQSVSLALKQTATVNEPASSQTESVLTPIDTRPLLPVVSQEPLDNVAPVLRFPARVASAIAKWGTRHSGKVAIILVALMIAGVIFVVDRRYPQEPGRDADQRKAYNVALAQLYSVAEQLEKVRSGQVPVERLKEALPGVSSLYARLNTPGPRDLKLTAGEICNNIGGEIWRLIRDPQAAAEAYQTSVQLYETLLNEQRDDDSCRRHLVDARLQYAKMLTL